jgi:hypothetical protein
LGDPLKQPGMKKAKAIESKMVSPDIRQARQKIERRAFGSLDAESTAEWLGKNNQISSGSNSEQ